jgi:hypothetical protein
MKRTTISTLVITIVLAAPLAWGGCDTSNCGDHSPRQPQEQQDVTGNTPQAEQPASKGMSRGASINDFVVGERAVEKDCANDANCREQGKTQQEPRAPEKKNDYGSGCK